MYKYHLAQPLLSASKAESLATVLTFWIFDRFTTIFAEPDK